MAPEQFAEPFAVAAPETQVPEFAVTIARRPLSLIFFDSGAVPNDGDVVRIQLNGTTVAEGLLLTESGTVVRFNASLFRSGVNLIEVTAEGSGTVPLNTIGIIFPGNQIAAKTRLELGFSLVSGETLGLTVGFPQIALCQTTFRFPCRPSGGLDVFPESSLHVLEAQGIPPEPISAPLLPGRTGNPLRAEYPRLLTINRGPDGNNPARRRSQSTADYECPPAPDGGSQDRDEYPPAVFLENEGSAHIKCISSQDNQQAGNSFGQQLRSYKEDPSLPAYPPFVDEDTIEFVILD